MSMFCYQCQETAGGKGCTKRGVCGKQDSTANLQDLTIYALKGLSYFTSLIRKNNLIPVEDVAPGIVNGLFMTITNANFDDEAFIKIIKSTLKNRDILKSQAEKAGIKPANIPDAASFSFKTDTDLIDKSKAVSLLNQADENIRSLVEMITYGLKGAAAYAEHALNLGFRDEEVMIYIQDTLAFLLEEKLTVDQLVSKTLETGKCGVSAMALLDKANTTTYGNPEITQVDIGVRNNPGILISGHDLKDMEYLLKQTENTGVDVYTHSEMLPANYYPAFKKYKHFAGNYGNAWWKQVEEFETFNGPVIFTSNCIVPPTEKSSYKDRIFTTNAAGFPGFKHICVNEKGEKDFSEVIELAKKCKPPIEIEKGTIIGGFAHNQVISLADKVVDAVKQGQIKKFVVMAGCDGRMKSRSYYTDFAEKLPKDTVILTAGCAKYRYNKLNLGDIGGIPRVLDAGQCNDSYSLVVIALKLQEVFGLDDINKLPIFYNIAWYEQKAVIVLLALLYLGVKNIHLGPTLPGFLSNDVAKVLIENFGIAGVTTPDEDIANFVI